MKVNQMSDVYYFWTEAESNTWGVTVADSTEDGFSITKEITIDALSQITADELSGGNGEGPRWGDAVLSRDGERLFVNARSADKVVVIDTRTIEVETILDVGDRPVHSAVYKDEIWVHVDGDGGFNVIDQDTLEVSELIEANTVGEGHGKLLLSDALGADTYATNTSEPAVFPIDLDSRTVGDPIIIAGGNPEQGTHDRGYDPATGLAFFELRNDGGYSFIDVETNEVVLDQVPIVGRATHTPDDQYLLILNADAEILDVGIWDTTLETHTVPKFDYEVTVGGQISVNGTQFNQNGEAWEAWIPQTEGDNVAVLDLATNEVTYVPVGNLTIPEGVRHFSRRGGIDGDYFFTHSDEGATRVDLDTYDVSAPLELPGPISRLAVVHALGTQLDDLLIGDSGDDYLKGQGGNDTIKGRDGYDELEGNLGHDQLYGNQGNDILSGHRGDDVLRGGYGDDTLRGGEEQDSLFGGSGRDFLYGGNGYDQLRGGEGNDFLLGQNGDDLLKGQQGNDVLEGGSGRDRFRFRFFDDGMDTILDFEAIDLIELSADGFGFSEAGQLDTSEFVVGSSATTADHRIIYDDMTGALFFDGDGSGAGAQIQFAELSTLPVLRETAFRLV